MWRNILAQNDVTIMTYKVKLISVSNNFDKISAVGLSETNRNIQIVVSVMNYIKLCLTDKTCLLAFPLLNFSDKRPPKSCSITVLQSSVLFKKVLC